jgi:hypothetical protein
MICEWCQIDCENNYYEIHIKKNVELSLYNQYFTLLDLDQITICEGCYLQLKPFLHMGG